jgi:hypothetical protein
MCRNGIWKTIEGGNYFALREGRVIRVADHESIVRGGGVGCVFGFCERGTDWVV